MVPIKTQTDQRRLWFPMQCNQRVDCIIFFQSLQCNFYRATRDSISAMTSRGPGRNYRDSRHFPGSRPPKSSRLSDSLNPKLLMKKKHDVGRRLLPDVKECSIATYSTVQQSTSTLRCVPSLRLIGFHSILN
jgi:hypothetical protein